MAVELHERSRGTLPSGSFAVDRADYSRTYALYDQALGQDSPVDTEELTAWIVRIIGGTLPGPATGALTAPGGAGSLVRLMPMADPQIPSLYADSVNVRIDDSLEAYDDFQAPTSRFAVPPIVRGYSRWNCYHLDVTFSARPYTVLPNERMTSAQLTWYDEDDFPWLLTYKPEWLRYVQWFVDDVDSRVSASVGSVMRYLVPSGDPAGVNDTVYTGIPDMIVPDQKVVARLFAIPARYLTSTNSYLLRYKGYVNQYDWNGFPRGSLLYLSTRVIRAYTPPQFTPREQERILGQGGGAFVNALAGSFAAEPLVDVELSYIYTARELRDAANEPPALKHPNRNWVTSGHALQPHFQSRQFLYAHTGATAAAGPPDYSTWNPQYPSCAHEILWQDPDVLGVNVPLPE